MKLFRFKNRMLFSSLLALWCYSGAYAVESQPSVANSKIDLKAAIKYAVSNNYSVASKRAAMEAQRANVGRVSSNHFPKFGLAGGVDSESESDEVASVGYLYGNWTIFSGFRDSYKSQIARLKYEQSIIDYQREVFQVGLDIEMQFHQYLYYKDLIRLTEEAIKLNDKHRKMVKRTSTSGLASKTDVMEFDLKDSFLKSDLVSLKQNKFEARAALRKLLGEEVGSNIEPVGLLQSQQMKISMDDFIKKIQTKIPDVLIAGKDRSISEVESKMWRSGWLPELSLETRAGYLPIGERSVDGDPTISVLLLAKMELFSGFDTRWESREKRANLAASKYKLKSQILNSITDIETSYRRLISLQEMVALEAGNEKLTKRYYDSVLKEYRRGYKNSADLSAAADGYRETAQKAVEYKFQFISKRIDLERSSGVKIPVGTAVEPTDCKGKKCN